MPIARLASVTKKHIPHAGLVVVPMTGHTVNIEEPGLCTSSSRSS